MRHPGGRAPHISPSPAGGLMMSILLLASGVKGAAQSRSRSEDHVNVRAHPRTTPRRSMLQVAGGSSPAIGDVRPIVHEATVLRVARLPRHRWQVTFPGDRRERRAMQAV